MFKVFRPQIQMESTKDTGVYDNFQDEVYLFIHIYLITCLVANLKQPLWSN
jgi:hypothetical protein